MTASHHPQAVWEDDGQTVYAVAPADGEIVVLDGSAALIWRLLDDGDHRPLTTRIADLTGGDPADIAAALPGFLADLRRRHLVVTDD